MTRRRWAVVALGGLLALASPAAAQEPSPSPTPPRISQDELDFQGRSSLAVGSGARALGMGGAFLARADDATAASWNPAGLSYLRRPEFSVVGARNGFDSTTRSGDDLGSDHTLGYTPDFLSVAHPIELGPVTGAGQFSFQRVIAFKGDRRIERGSNNLRLESTSGFDVLALGTGLQVSRKVRLGATANRWIHGFRQTRTRVERPTAQQVNFRLSGWNANLGVIWTPVQSLNVAAVGKTPFTAKVTLSRFRSDSSGDEMTQNFFSSEAVRLDFPGALGTGFSWRPRSTLALSGDYTRTYWSAGRIHNFFTLPQKGVPEAPDDIFETLPYPDLLATDQADTEQFRFGVEYVLIRNRLKVPLRAGYFKDKQYFGDVNGKPPTFNGFTVGSGILAGSILLDFAYLREARVYSTVEGRTRIKINRFFASLIYRHNSKP